jgi:hypothetical protein
VSLAERVIGGFGWMVCARATMRFETTPIEVVKHILHNDRDLVFKIPVDG